MQKIFLNQLPKTVEDKVVNELEISKEDASKRGNYEYAKAVDERIEEIRYNGLDNKY